MPPAPSIATRNIPLRSRRSFRGAIVGGDPPRIHQYESGVERDYLLLALTDPNVSRIEEQPMAVAYETEKGLMAHTFDFRIFTITGRRIAVEVKPKLRAERQGWLERLRVIAAQTPPSFATEISLVTEDDIPAWKVANARLFWSVRNDPPSKYDEALNALLTGLTGPISVANLVRVLGSGEHGFRPVARAIADGRLRLLKQEVVSFNTLVEVCA